MAHRQAHHHRRGDGTAGARRVRGGYAGHAGSRRVGNRRGRVGRVFSGVPPVLGPLPLRQLPPPQRADLCGARGGGRGEVRSRSPDLLRADLRGDQRPFLVQRSASRVVTFAIMRSNASSRSIFWEFARQITTNRISASSSARSPSASSFFFVFSPK